MGDADRTVLRQLGDLDGWVAPVGDAETAAFARLEAAGLIKRFETSAPAMALTGHGYAAIGRAMRLWR